MSYLTNIVNDTLANTYFRKVLHTGAKSQLVVMSIPPGGEIGAETHANVEQTLFFLDGTGVAILDGKKQNLIPGDVLVVTPGTKHNVVCTGVSPLKIYTVYAPPNHIDGRVHITKADADKDVEDEEYGNLVGVLPKNGQVIVEAEKQAARSSVTLDVPQQVTIELPMEATDDALSTFPLSVDVAALSQLYNAPPGSRILCEDMLEQARASLMKYELAEADFEIAADSLARSMYMLLEQHGMKNLAPEQLAKLEEDVLKWYGFCQPAIIEE